MKQITAVVRPSKVDAVKNALVGIDVVGMTINDVRGFGRQKGQVERYRGNEFTVDFLSKIRITTVVSDDKVEAAISNSFGFGGHNSAVIFAPYKA